MTDDKLLKQTHSNTTTITHNKSYSLKNVAKAVHSGIYLCSIWLVLGRSTLKLHDNLIIQHILRIKAQIAASQIKNIVNQLVRVNMHDDKMICHHVFGKSSTISMSSSSALNMENKIMCLQ